MQDISLHLLDIIENSVRAQASNVWIALEVAVLKNRLSITVRDDGTGMDAETLQHAQDPFYTTKLERVKKVGLGIPLFKQNAEMCGGSFCMSSTVGQGTELQASFRFDHVDRMPIGSLADTLLGSIIGHPEVDFHVHLSRKFISGDEAEFEFSTAVIKAELGDIPITYPDVIAYVNDTIQEGIKNTKMEEL
jgi:signal transduction histidine kinase